MVRCSDQSYYTGVTNSTERRVKEHNEGRDPKSYTFRRRPVELVYSAMFEDLYEAIAWEKILKKWSRKKKEAVIRGEWEALPQLSYSSYMKRIQSIRAMVRRAHHDTLCLPH